MNEQEHPRMRRERKTFKVMLDIYCQGVHGTRGALCADCQQLLDYAMLRLDRCPFQESKPTCANCRVHCYRPAMREKVRAMMRYAGPRMLYRHPVLAFLHLVVDGRRNR